MLYYKMFPAARVLWWNRRVSGCRGTVGPCVSVISLMAAAVFLVSHVYLLGKEKRLVNICNFRNILHLLRVLSFMISKVAKHFPP